MQSTNRFIRRITTFTTGVALGLSILSGPASAASATPSEPSGNSGAENQAPPAGEVMSDDAAPLVDTAPPAEEAATAVVGDATVLTAPLIVEDDTAVPPPAVPDSPVVATEPASSEVRPAVNPVRGIPAPPVVALAPGNWGISARVVGVRKAPRVLSFDSKPAPQVLALRITREDTLPRTGIDTGVLTMVGGLLLAVGAVLTRQGRAPSPAAAGTTRSS